MPEPFGSVNSSNIRATFSNHASGTAVCPPTAPAPIILTPFTVTSRLKKSLPSPTTLIIAPLLYSGSTTGVRLVSLIVTLCVVLVPFNVNTNVSVPSVVASAVTLNVAVAVLLFTVKLPVKLAPPMSALNTPVIVYGTVVPSVTFVVVNVIVNELPSLTDATELDSEYVAAAG